MPIDQDEKLGILPIGYRWRWKAGSNWVYCDRAPMFRVEERVIEPVYAAPTLDAPTYEQGVAAGLEMAAKVAACAFDDRPRLRSGNMDWTDGYYDGSRAAEVAIRALAYQRKSSTPEDAAS